MSFSFNEEPVDPLSVDPLSVDPLSVETASMDPSSLEAPEFKASLFDAPTVSAPQVDAPQIDAPYVDPPRTESSRIVTPRADTPLTDTPLSDIAPVKTPPPDRRAQRQHSSVQRARAREARWNNNRLAVPYPTDGPKVTLGVLWFLLLVGAVLLGPYFDEPLISSVAIAGVAAPVAGLAGLQVGNAWFPNQPATRGWIAAAAYISAISGFYGGWGVLVGAAIGLIVLMFYLVLYRGHRRTAAQLFDVLVRSALPVGIAVASLAALGSIGIGVQLSLILLVSAYEAGDFIVGSGSSNAVEGPLAGVVALGAVTFLLFLIQPAPFDETSILLFSALAAICCPLGQILASGLLPRGNTWAPGLRRLDSYLLVAPIWLVLVSRIPTLG